MKKDKTTWKDELKAWVTIGVVIVLMAVIIILFIELSKGVQG